MSEMSGRTAQCWHTGQMPTKSGKSLMNAFLRARTTFGFEYLISFRAEHNDADRDITYGNRRTGGEKMEARKSSRRFKVGEISEHDCSNFPQNWQN